MATSEVANQAIASLEEDLAEHAKAAVGKVNPSVSQVGEMFKPMANQMLQGALNGAISTIVQGYGTP